MEKTNEIKILRAMAWARAKGELMSMLETFVNNHDNYMEFRELLGEFISKVEGNELEK